MKNTLFAAIFLLSCLAATAQTAWPSKPLRFIVAAPAGSSLDVVARTMSESMRPKLSQPIVVENIAGGSGSIATIRLCSRSTAL
jgi:tripartite-type tricarboxylate transporter receptor subunit TctC